MIPVRKHQGKRRKAQAVSEPCSQATRDLLERLLAAHEAWFDVSKDYAFAGRTWPGYAEFHSQAEKYVLVKRAKLWGANVHEYLFFETVPLLDATMLEDLVDFMTTEALAKVDLVPDHMTSYLSLVVLADAASPEAAKLAQKARFRKNYRLGLQGWADLRVAVVDVGAAKVYANARGRELMPTLLAHANMEAHEPSEAMRS